MTSLKVKERQPIQQTEARGAGVPATAVAPSQLWLSEAGVSSASSSAVDFTSR